MKKLAFLAILASSTAFGQLSISPFCSATLGKSETGFKNRTGLGLALSLDLNENIGIEIQAKNREIWSMSAQDGKDIPLKTASLQFYIYQDMKNSSRWFFRPSIGILGGIGEQIVESDATRKSLQLLENPYFFGLTIEFGAGFKLSEKFSLAAYAKEEAIVGQISNRAIVSENFTSLSNLLIGLSLKCNFRKTKNPYQF